MKKSMLNVIILALVLVNLVLTVILTFSLVSTNKKTNSLINKWHRLLTWMLQAEFLIIIHLQVQELKM